MKEVELTRARFELAADMIDRLFPDAPLPEKMQLISQLMPELVKLIHPALTAEAVDLHR